MNSPYIKTNLSYDVLITALAGHLGTALMLSLPSLGFKSLGIDILPSQTTILVGSVSTACLDIRNDIIDLGIRRE